MRDPHRQAEEAVTKIEALPLPVIGLTLLWVCRGVLEGAARGPAATSEASDCLANPDDSCALSNAAEQWRPGEWGPQKPPPFVALHWAATAALLARSEPSDRAKVVDAAKECLRRALEAAEVQGLTLDLDELAARAKEGKSPGRLSPHR